MRYTKNLFSVQKKRNRNLLDYYHDVDHHIQIVLTDITVTLRYMSRPSCRSRLLKRELLEITREQNAGILSTMECMTGTLFYDSSFVLLFNRVITFGIIKN